MQNDSFHLMKNEWQEELQFLCELTKSDFSQVIILWQSFSQSITFNINSPSTGRAFNCGHGNLSCLSVFFFLSLW